MVQALDDRWESIDLPVLITAARLLLEQPNGLPVRCAVIAESLERPVDEVFKSLRELSDTYLRTSDAGARKIAGISMGAVSVTSLTDAGRVATGLWPAEGDVLMELLEQVATALDDAPGGKPAAKGIRGWLSDASSGAAAGVAANVAPALPSLIGRMIGG